MSLEAPISPSMNQPLHNGQKTELKQQESKPDKAEKSISFSSAPKTVRGRLLCGPVSWAQARRLLKRGFCS